MDKWIFFTTLIIFFLYFLILIFYYFIYNENITSSCKIGECVTNIKTGKKVCPNNDNEILNYDPNIEVCNFPNFCNNPITPYALNENGSTNNNGVCEMIIDGNGAIARSNCDCLTKPKCSDFISSIFTINFNQKGETYYEQKLVEELPLNKTSFCYVTPSFIKFSSPGCSFLNEINKDSMSTCMNLNKNCDNKIKTSPCLKGNLVYLQKNDEEINYENTPIACVNIESNCSCGQISVYNEKNEIIKCL